MTLKSGLLTLTTAAALVGMSGCGSSADQAGTDANTPSQAQSSPAPDAESSEPAPSEEPVVITIKGFQYEGPDSVPPGATIMVKNLDKAAHTVTAEGDGGFDVRIEGDGGTAEFTAPEGPGDSPYICTFHPDMADTLVVE